MFKTMRCVLLAAVLLLPGCALFPQRIGQDTRIVDAGPEEVTVPPVKGSRLYEKAWSDGETLLLECVQMPGLNLARVEPVFFNNEVYLDSTRISSGGSARVVFRIDLSEFDLPDDWTDRVYWIVGSSYSGLFSRTPLEIRRLKVHVQNGAEGGETKGPADVPNR